MNSPLYQTTISVSLAVALVAVCGCGGPGGGSKDAAATPEKPTVAKTEIERGPVRVTVQFEPNPARLSDEPTLTLSIDYQRGVNVDKPPFGEAVGDFLVRDFREPLPEASGDREVLRQIYTLEPTRTGKLQIDPIVITFTDNRGGAEGQQYTVETEALNVEVASVLPSDLPTLDDLKPAAGPVELPARASAVWGWLTGVFLLTVAVGLVVWRVRRRGQASEAPQLTPQELAYMELQELLEAGLGEQEIKLFYVRLTGIVRRYIERTTGIHAPEQTTEEFLRELGCNEVFARGERQRLKDFLESADLVKYAAHQPQKTDVERTFQRAKVFIGLESAEVAA